MSPGKKKPPARKKSAPEATDDLSFEAALDRLEAVVARLEQGEVPLEESIQAYADGTRLVRHCLVKLEAAETTIRELSEGSEGFRLEPSTLSGAVDDEEPVEEEDDEEDEDEDGELPF
jgi:exodeoxyribonuclease VII small subunit